MVQKTKASESQAASLVVAEAESLLDILRAPGRNLSAAEYEPVVSAVDMLPLDTPYLEHLKIKTHALNASRTGQAGEAKFELRAVRAMAKRLLAVQAENGI